MIQKSKVCPEEKSYQKKVYPKGSLVIERRANGIREFYYRRRVSGHEDYIKIGTYSQDISNGHQLLSLHQARNLAAKIADKYSDVPNLKLAYEIDKNQEAEAAKAAREEEFRKSHLGSLNDLFNAYTENMRHNGKTSWQQVRKQLARYISKPFPELGNKPAHTITAQDITRILKQMADNGITTTCNRVRGDLHAAFNFGMQHDHSPWDNAIKNVFFEIESNPVSKIKPNRKWERQSDRVLSPHELSIVWKHSGSVMGKSYGSLLKVMICTGLRPTDMIRLSPRAIDLERGSAYITETKNGIPNLIPLNQYAIQVLEPLILFSDGETLFPTAIISTKSSPTTQASVFSNFVAKLRGHLRNINEPVEFTARDIRRTVKTLMGEAGISKDIRDRLQNHALSDVSSRHYDRYDYWPEKVAASKKWEKWMERNLFKGLE